MPPIFNSEGLTKELSGKLLAVGVSKDRKKSGFDDMSYRRTRHPNIPRVLSIPHPLPYLMLVDTIIKNWDDNIGPVCQSPNSNLIFEIQQDFRIFMHSYNAISIDGDVENHDPSLDFGMNYKIKTDITNFYPSIYSHSLPWALAGHKEAKKQRDQNIWFNKIDSDTRRCKRNETKGINIGPATSNILSEIILFQIDSAMREKNYNFSRYIDDYTAYTETKAKADMFLVDLAKELEKYALSLNPKKTEIREMPVQNAPKWIVEMNQILALAGMKESEIENDNGKLNFKLLRLIIEKAVILSEEYPDGSVIKYAFSAILEIGVSGDDSERYLQDSLLKYAFYFPSLIPLIHRWTGSYALHSEIEARVHKLYRHSLQQGQSDNVVWCIYYLLRTIDHNHQEILSEVCEDEAPLSMLMGYVYAKKKGYEVKAISDWANLRIESFKSDEIDAFDIDRYWLVFYQLYLDGIISTPPYKESKDNKIFEILKEHNMSFINYEHPDLDNPIEKIFGKIIHALPEGATAVSSSES